MRQYWEQKKQVGEAMLLFRMGDFYEIFYDDAVRAARLLGITLTSRDGGRTPLAGIPHHALESYLSKLVAAGVKVAISEQIEESRPGKGIVARALSRIVTPGTLTDESLLDRTRSNVIAAVCEQDAQAGVAALELSTGAFTVQVCPAERLLDELCRLAPAEVLLADSGAVGRHPLQGVIGERVAAATTLRPAGDFGLHQAERLLMEQFETRSLAGFGFERMDCSLRAAGALVAYVHETQRAATRHMCPPLRRELADHMILDATTLRSLEVERSLRAGTRAGSLLDAVDHTCNPMGARLLRQWLCYPLRNVDAISRRSDLVEALRGEESCRVRLRAALRETGDIERMIGRLGVQRTTPRDLRALGEGLSRFPEFRALLRELRCPHADALAGLLEGLEELAAELCATLRPEAPITLRDGEIFAAGHNAELDRLRAIGQDGQRWLSDYQANEIRRSGISSLKVGFNKVHGYYIEITNVHRSRVPDDYVRKQTIKNAERYVTDELKRYEVEALTAETRSKELEYELFLALREHVSKFIRPIQSAAAALANIDVLAGWAELAIRRRYCRPEFAASPLLEIADGRHPVVEQSLEGTFVANDTRLLAHPPLASGSGAEEAERGEVAAGGSLALITGPNMAGKSTYIRQVALLTLLAHCGCWVPARAMRLGLADRIFTRVGASDDLAAGQSTFMVEMLETANILHNATPESLVILDEIGRGTSTFDGLSLAWAITEQLATRVGCRTLFASHYHELTELAELLPTVFNLNVAVREFEDQVVFLHRIVPGAADRSYGLHVAKLAGIPRPVIERANAVLNELEKTFSRESQRPVLAAVQRRRQRQLRLFEEPEEAVVRELRNVELDKLEPARALECIRAWRAALRLDSAEGRTR